MSKRVLKEKIAFYISLTTSPYMVAVYFAIISSLYFANNFRQFMTWFPVQVLFTAAVPLGVSFALLKRGRITDLHFSINEDRKIFLLVALPVLPVYLTVLAYVNAPLGLLIIVLGYSVTAIAVALASFRTKVSAHSAAITACAAGLFILLESYVIPLMGLVPMVVWARLHRGRHTLGQALIGVIIASSIMLVVFLIYEMGGL
jgi:hypothetical protein